MLPWAHQSPQNKWHIDWFSRFYTAHCRIHILYNGPSFSTPQKFKTVPTHGGLDPSNARFLGPTKSTTQTTGLTTVIVRQTDRQTDHAIASVTIGRIYVSAGFHKFLLEVRSRGVWRTKSPRNRSILASAKHYFVHNLQLVQNFTPSQQLQIINHLQKQQIPNVHVFGDRKMRLIKKTNGRNDEVSLMSV